MAIRRDYAILILYLLRVRVHYFSTYGFCDEINNEFETSGK